MHALRIAPFPLLAGLVVAFPGAAHADMRRAPSVALGLDLGVLPTASQGADSATGFGALARAGYEFGNGVTPELVLSYSEWNRTVLGLDVGESQLSVLPGLRWSILGGAIRPWISFHLGYGRLMTSTQTPGPVVEDSRDGIGLNTGLGLDFLITRRIGVGLHATWNKVIAGQDKQTNQQVGEAWFDVGAGLVFQL